MPTVLDSIVDGVRADLAEREAALPLARLKAGVIPAGEPFRGLAALAGPDVAVLAEVKRAFDFNSAIFAELTRLYVRG